MTTLWCSLSDKHRGQWFGSGTINYLNKKCLVKTDEDLLKFTNSSCIIFKKTKIDIRNFFNYSLRHWCKQRTIANPTNVCTDWLIPLVGIGPVDGLIWLLQARIWTRSLSVLQFVCSLHYIDTNHCTFWASWLLSRFALSMKNRLISRILKCFRVCGSSPFFILKGSWHCARFSWSNSVAISVL